MDLLHLPQAIATLVALLILYKIWRLISRNNKAMVTPEPKVALPIIGHLHLFRGKTPPFRTLAALADIHGPIFSIRLGIQKALVVSCKEAAAECFTVNDRAFLSRPKTAALNYMGYNGAMSVLGPDGKYWLELRRVMTLQLLSNRHLETLKHVRTSEVDSCIKELYSLCVDNVGSTIDMIPWFRGVTMNLMLRTIAGKRYSLSEVEEDDGEVESRRFARAMDKFMHLAGVFEVSDVIPHVEWMDLQGNLRSMKRNGEEMDYFMSKWLQEHVESKEAGGHVTMKEEQDFMDVMLSLFPDDGEVHGHQNKDIIKGTALSLILGGSDTTTATISWALSLLLNHNKVLKDVQEELDMYIGRERWVEESDVKNLIYLQAVVKETLRLYPPGPLLIPRESTKDCHVAGYYVPKGTRLLVNAWKLHRDPSVWIDPHEFRPERFLTTHSKVNLRGQQFEYLPFSSGRRSCLGVTFASQMMHLILGRLLQGFDFATPMNGSVDMTEGLGLSLPKATPLEVLLTPRFPSKFYQE